MGGCLEHEQTVKRAADLGITERELCDMLLEEDPEAFLAEFTDPAERAMENCLAELGEDAAAKHDLTVEEACELQRDDDLETFVALYG